MFKKIAILLCVLSVGVGNITWAESGASTPEILPIFSGVGGDFTALDAKGETIRLSDFQGKAVVLAFGYTNCADICPFTLGYLKRLYATLSAAQQAQVQILFVTIDPTYDTPSHLNAFVTHFNQSFIGLSGSQKQIDYIVSLFQAEYHALSTEDIPTQDVRRIIKKQLADGEKDTSTLFSHTVTIYLLDKKSNVRSLEFTGSPLESFAGKINQLIGE